MIMSLAVLAMSAQAGNKPWDNGKLRVSDNQHYLQFDNGVWHYGRCAVRPRPGHTVTGQTLIRLKNVQPNKNYLTKKQYPFFAQYDVTRL